MNSEEIKNLLEGIYRLAPELRPHEEELRRLIADMSAFKPEIKLDAAFVAQLRNKILSAPAGQSAETLLDNKKDNLQINSFLFNFMNKKIYLTVGSLAVLVLALVAITTALQKDVPGTEKILALLPKEKQAEVSRLNDEAFGSLIALSPASDGTEMGRAGVMGLGGNSGLTAPAATSDLALESGSLLEEKLAGEAGEIMAGDAAISSDMRILPYPYYEFNYRYSGDELELSAERGDVYRRLKGDGQLAKNLGGLLNNLNIPLVNMKAFSKLNPTNLSLAEDRDQGLLISLDFNEDQVYISENWEKWRIAEREACGDNAACWERFRLKPTDVPADEELISMADRFLSSYGISREHYGAGRVIDDNWREIYAQTNDLSQVYIPEYATVAYPLMLDGQEVRDQAGGYSGLRVNINLLKKAPSGLYGLSPYRYESSAYELETDTAKIIAAAEKGGWNRGFWGGSENSQTLALDTPQKVYVQFWRYNQASGRSDELLIPALAFPILNRPSDLYYGPRLVTVPLVKEILEELNRQNDGPIIMRGGLGGEPEIDMVITY